MTANTTISGNTIEKFYYPNDIKNDSLYKNRQIIFLAVTGKGNGEDRDSYYKQYKELGVNPSDNVLAEIVLPLSNSIRDSQSHNWVESDYSSAFTGAAEALSDRLKNDSNGFLSSIGSTLSSGLDVFSSFKEMIDSPQKAALADLLGQRRPMLNPGYFQNYSGSSLRSFSFNFDFIPESVLEARQAIEIVKAFKKYSSPSRPITQARNDVNPEKTGNFSLGDPFILTPCHWEVVVQNETVYELLSFHKCVCTNVDVTYGDSDKVALFKDGIPKQISLTLSFSEATLQFADAYGNVPSWLYEVSKKVYSKKNDIFNSIDQVWQDVKNETSTALNNLTEFGSDIVKSTYWPF